MVDLGSDQDTLASGDPALLEVIGPWTEVKQEIIEKYARVYSTILSSRQRPQFHHVYIDAFAGAGHYLSKAKGIAVPGSAQRALAVEPPFREHFFIDLDSLKVARLEALARDRSDVTVLHGDCNQVLVEEVLPRVRYDQFRRGLCILDPYGLQLNWSTIEAVAKARSIEIFLNFPTMDINRNVLRRDPAQITLAQASRLTAFWGDESWRELYRPMAQRPLWGEPEDRKSATNEEVAEMYRQRLEKVAGFAFVPRPLPMRNSTNAIVYYLFFASHHKLGKDIAEDIIELERVFARYRKRG
ncbi:MAG: three-Cys-motif partner protein TcmP [Chloroflexia bacterium]|nr:three-Cys-motif partner protein TcmP [Chloroflexia bacterium]